MLRPLVLSALVAMALVGKSQQKIKACNPDDYKVSEYSDKLKSLSLDGFEMGIEAAVLGGPNDYESYFIQTYGDGKGRGTYYVSKAHIYETFMYDLNAKVSHRLFNDASKGTGSCEFVDITAINDLSYNHKTLEILLVERLFQFSNFKFKDSNGDSDVYRGMDVKIFKAYFKDSQNNYEYAMTFYLSDDSKWTTEADANNPIPLAVDMCVWKGSNTLRTATLSFVNFHTHLDAVPGSTAFNLLFTPPSLNYCPKNGGSPMSPMLTQRYSFRGEYTTERNKTASPILVAYDDKYKLIRYDFLPTEDSGLYGFQHAWLQDGTTGVKYNVDLITRHCSAYNLTDNSRVDFSKGAMALVGHERLTNDVLKKLQLIAVKPCRHMSCDAFTMADDKTNFLYEYSFISDIWAEKNMGSINVTQHNLLAQVGRAPIPGKGDVLDSEAVEIFDFVNDQYRLWQFEVAELCYKRSSTELFKHSWVRLVFNGDHNTLEAENNAYLKSAMLEAIADAAKISPMRASDLVFDVYRDQLNAEFIIWEPHPVSLKPPGSRDQPTSLADALKNLNKVVSAGTFVVRVGDSSLTSNYYSITADPNTFEQCDGKCSNVDASKVKLMYTDGFTMGMQAAVYIPPLPPVLSVLLPFKTPLQTTYYIEAYHGYAEGEQGGHGSLIVYDRSTNYSVIYNEHAKESVLIQHDTNKCEIKPMTFDDSIFPFGYLHGGLPIPLPDVIADMGKWVQHRLRQRGKSWNHGFKTDVFEAEAEVGEVAGITLPASIPITVRWYWLDKDFESEDGRYDKVGNVPISIQMEATVPFIPGFGQYAGTVAYVYLSVVNYHNHYPDPFSTIRHTTDPLRELLEIPAGIYCGQRIHEPAVADKIPQVPELPQRFKMKTETVVRAPYDYVINSQDYMDYNRTLFRYDISQHNPEMPGLQAMTQITVDYNADTFYIIDHENREQPCQHGKISTADYNSHPALRHVLLAPTELLNLTNLNEQFHGIKACRDMSCYYWIGMRPIASLPGHTGTFEIWSTTLKWHTLEDQLDQKSTTFVKITVTIRNDKTKAIEMREDIEIYDMLLLGPKDLAEFAAPTAAFCRGENGDPDKLTVPKGYMYRGEYVNYAEKDKYPVQNFHAYYDARPVFNFNIFRYDHAPSREQGDEPAYRSSWLVDMDANVLFDVDRVTGQCQVFQSDLENRAGIWELIYPKTLEASIGNYIGAHPCRSKFCETFMQKTVFDPRNGWTEFEAYFTGPNWSEFNSDNPKHEDSNVLTRIGKNGYKGDGSIRQEMHQSVDMFSLTEDIRMWDYRFLDTCFAKLDEEGKKIDGNYQHFLISVVDMNDRGDNLPDNNEFFKAAMVEALADTTKVKPYRILNVRFKKYHDEYRVGFAIVERHELDTVGLDLATAIVNLQNIVTNGPIPIPAPDLTKVGDDPMLEMIDVKVRTVTDCGKSACDIDADRPVVFVFDAATAFGVFFGCFVGGALIMFVVLGFVYSRRLRVSFKDVYLVKSPSGPSNPAPVNLSGLSYR